jgi:hypothetical protein
MKSESFTLSTQWNTFLDYARSRLQRKAEFFVSPESLAEACFLQTPFWEDLEALWRQERPSDFNYDGQHWRVSGEPSMIRFWRTS